MVQTTYSSWSSEKTSGCHFSQTHKSHGNKALFSIVTLEAWHLQNHKHWTHSSYTNTGNTTLTLHQLSVIALISIMPRFKANLNLEKDSLSDRKANITPGKELWTLHWWADSWKKLSPSLITAMCANVAGDRWVKIQNKHANICPHTSYCTQAPMFTCSAWAYHEHLEKNMWHLLCGTSAL